MDREIFDAYFEKYCSLKSEDEQLNFQKDFMLSLSFEELKAWTQYLSDDIDAQIQKNLKQGLTEEDKDMYIRFFDRVDSIVEQLHLKKAA
jgi:uncharacterized protein YpiB (UPF0302 family)